MLKILNSFFLLFILFTFQLNAILSQSIKNYTFDKNSLTQFYIVPSNTARNSVLYVQAYGAQGGQNGGFGGSLLVKTIVDPGQVFAIDIGETTDIGPAHGGGGEGYLGGGSGGGATYVSSKNFQMIAAGGGGGANDLPAGVGGGEEGGSANKCTNGYGGQGATGGTLFSGGQAAMCAGNSNQNNGGFLIGASGSGWTDNDGPGPPSGGGGGGYYGGGGGIRSPGAGGSSNATGNLEIILNLKGQREGSGMVLFTLISDTSGVIDGNTQPPSNSFLNNTILFESLSIMKTEILTEIRNELSKISNNNHNCDDSKIDKIIKKVRKIKKHIKK